VKSFYEVILRHCENILFSYIKGKKALSGTCKALSGTLLSTLREKILYFNDCVQFPHATKKTEPCKEAKRHFLRCAEKNIYFQGGGHCVWYRNKRPSPSMV
jgi:hypothetical protein